MNQRSLRTHHFRQVMSIFTGIIDAKPEEYHGVLMRSRLEADFARHLHAMGEDWTYEPRVYAPSTEAAYLPDFELVRADGRSVFIEVKPTLAEVRAAARKMEVIWRWDPTAVLIVACAEGSRWYGATAGERWTSWVERWRHA